VDIVTSLIFLAVGAGAGFAVARMLSGKTTTDIEARVRADTEADRARLTTQLEEQAKRAQEFVAQVKANDLKFEAANAKIVKLERTEAELIARLQAEKAATVEKLALVTEAKKQLEDAFAALSKRALDQNSESFVNYAKSVLDSYQQSAQADLQQRQERISDLVTPVKESLEKVDGKIQDLEAARAGALGELRQQITQVADAQQQLRTETQNLVMALRNSSTRGRWGEIQLRRVVELAGMVNYCDFQEQASVTTEDGKLRPDLIIKLPSERVIIVDSKAPMESFLSALDAADDGARREHYKNHAQKLRGHVTALSQKSYAKEYKSPEFVLLFLPMEALYSAALEHDADLLEYSAGKNIIIATPSTLIALLRAAAFGWKQESLGKEIEQVALEGRTLYKRLSKLSEHIANLGSSLNKSVKAYNSMLGSLEHSVLPSARRIGKKVKVTSAGEGVINEMPPIELSASEAQAPELLQSDDETVMSDEISVLDAEDDLSDEDAPAMPQVISLKVER
jgi:DNA recombination protein RmuC